MAFDRATTERREALHTELTGAGAGASAPILPTRARAVRHGALECGASSVMQRIRKLVDQSAASDLPVLITGEVGVGKDLIAREIHRRSGRAAAPLVEINCASLSEESLGSDMADGDGVGEQLANAKRTTLFLNGVGELSPGLQDRLLRLLRDGDSPRDRTRRPADVRLIAATHRDLTAAVEAGRFNEDLYYRLNLIHIHVPPLRTHLEDVPALIAHFLREHGGDGADEELPEIIRSRMLAHEWPGNIRELENAVRAFVALRDPTYVLEELEARADHDRRASATHSAYPPRRSAPPAAYPHDDGNYVVDLKKIGREASDAAERDAIVDMLIHTLGNKKAAARRLGISYKALLYKIRDFGIAEGVHAEEDASRCGKDALTAQVD